MKYYSESLKQFFDAEEDLHAAEKANEEAIALKKAKQEERAAKAKEVEDAYKKYLQLKADFIKEYGSYHQTLTSDDLPDLTNLSLVDLFDRFWL